MVDHQSFVFHPSVISSVRYKSRKLVQSRSDHNWSDIPDLEQAMFLQLIMKQDQFTPDRGSHCTFASTVLDRWIAEYLRDRGRIKRGGAHRTTSFSQLESGTPTQNVSFDDLLSDRDGDRRRWRSTESHIDRFDRQEALRLAMSMLTECQSSLLRDVAMHSVSFAARQRRVSRRQIDAEIESIRRICIKCGLNLNSVYNRSSNGIGTW